MFPTNKHSNPDLFFYLILNGYCHFYEKNHNSIFHKICLYRAELMNGVLFYKKCLPVLFNIFLQNSVTF